MTDDHADIGADVACTEEVEMITDFLEGALPEAEHRRLEAHLVLCEGCTEYLEQIRAVAGALGGLREDALPTAVRSDLLAAFRRFRRGGEDTP